MIIVLGWPTKNVVEHYAGVHPWAWHGLTALNKVVKLQASEGALKATYMPDNGFQPISMSFM